MTDPLSTRFETATLEQLPWLLDELSWIVRGRVLQGNFRILVNVNTPGSLYAAAMMLAPVCEGEGGPIIHAWLFPKSAKVRVFSDDETGHDGLGHSAAAALGAAIARSLEK